MISTIGSLVQATTNRWRWLLSMSLYIVACVSTAALLGAILGAPGHITGAALGRVPACAWLTPAGPWLIGLLAVGYAASDLELIVLLRPTLMFAVPVTWWRRWSPYKAALAYGAALGLGVTTAIAFGSFYVLCAICVLRGDSAYGALLMGAYGAARAFVIVPASWNVYSCPMGTKDRLSRVAASLPRAKAIVAIALIMLGVQYILTAML